MPKWEKPSSYNISIDGEIRFSSYSEKAYYDFFEGGSLSSGKIREKRLKRNSLNEMNDFNQAYSDSEIRQDKQLINHLKINSSEEKMTRESELFEFLMSEPSLCLFSDLKLNSTTQFDDRINHTDAWTILKTQTDSGKKIFPKIAFDFTVASDEEVLNKKIKKVAGEISQGTLTSLKYVKMTKTKGDKKEMVYGLKKVPRVIIKCQKEEIEKICRILYKLQENDKSEIYQKSRYLFQLNFLKESLDQLTSQLGCLKEGSQTKKIIKRNLGNSPAKQLKNLNLQVIEENLKYSILALEELIEETKEKISSTETDRSVSSLVPEITNLNVSFSKIIIKNNGENESFRDDSFEKRQIKYPEKRIVNFK